MGNVLTVNAGSSSLKLAVLDDDDAVVVSGDDLAAVLEKAGEVTAWIASQKRGR